MDLETQIAGLPVDLFSVDLTNNVETITGNGHLYLNASGIVELKLFPHDPKENTIENFINDLNQSNRNVGKIIPAESYYRMNAISVNGDSYFCQRILIKDHDNFKVYYGQLSADLFINNDPDFDDFKSARVEIPYKLKLPFNRGIEIEKRYSDKWTSRKLSREVFEIDFIDKTVDIFSRDKTTVILIQGKENKIVESDIFLIILALEFLTCSLINGIIV